MARFAAAAPPAAAASSDGRNVTLPPDSLNNEGDGRAHRLTRGSSGRKTSGAKSKKAGGTLPYSLLATFYKGATGERPPQLDAETRALTTTTASCTSPTGSRRNSTLRRWRNAAEHGIENEDGTFSPWVGLIGRREAARASVLVFGWEKVTDIF